MIRNREIGIEKKTDFVKGSEVMNFLCAEYDYEMDMQYRKKEAYEEGFERGIERGALSERINRICKKLKKSCTPEQIAEQLEEDIEFVNLVCQLAKGSTSQYNEEEILNHIIGQAH